MNKLKNTIQATVAGMLLLTTSWAQAQTITEQEVNHPIYQAQKLDFNSGRLVIKAALGTNDTDYFYFYAKEGDVVTVDIDGGTFDSILGVFRSVPGFPLLRINDNATLDEGSTSTWDARIDNFTVGITGNYVIGVSNSPRFFQNGGGFLFGDNFKSGNYTLVISGVTPETQQISIDIKPGSTDLAPFNPRSKGKIPVALLSSKAFNALTTVPSSLTFGVTGTEVSLSHCGTNGEDVNGDGLLDLVCHFESQLTGVQKGDLEAILRGRSTTGTAFEGRGFLKIVPEKRGS